MHKLFILLLLLTSLYSKNSDFSVIIDEPFNDALFDITQDYDRQISAVGFSKNYKQSSTKNNTTYTNAFNYLNSIADAHGSQMHLVKIDKYANLTLSQATKMSKFSEAIAVVKTPSNGYFVGGHTLGGSLIILKLDASGNIIFNKLFGTKNYDRMNNLIKLSDGGILAIGSSITSRSQHDNLFETGLGLNDIFITRFSKDGRKLWSKKYGTRYDDRGIDAVESFDGSILVLSATSYDNNKDITLMRITENGNKIWLKHFKTKKIITPHKIIRLRDNNFLVSLAQKDEMNKEQIRLIKFDLQKNMLQEYNITTKGSNILSDIKERSNGAIVAVGHRTTRLKTEAMAITLDNTLHPIWQRFFDNFERSSFHALSLLHDGTIAIAGERTKKGQEITDMWVIKLNRDGSTTQIASQENSLYDTLHKTFESEIKAQKITIDKDLTINLIASELFFKAGEYKLSSKQTVFLHRFNYKLIQALYPYKESITALHVNGHTSSEWGKLNQPERYLNNVKLSSKRAFEVLAFTYQDHQLHDFQEWLSTILSSNGLSYAKRVMNTKENKEKSRRVNFKIEVK